MANLSLYSHILKPQESSISYADAAQKGINLRQLGMQNDQMEAQMAAEEQARQRADRERRFNVVGSAMESMERMTPEQRQKAYPGIRQSLLEQGAINPQDAMEVLDEDKFQQTLGLYKRTKDSMDRQSARADIDLKRAHAAKFMADAAKDNAAAKLPKNNLSPGEKKADEEFAKDAAEYNYGGGKASVEKNFGKIQDSIGALRKNPGLTGGLTTAIPFLADDERQDIINPQMAKVRDDMRGAIQGTLRQVLGPQFTEKEGTAIFSRAFNPRLSGEENARRAEAELDALRRMAESKDAAQRYFIANGTLKGFQPGDTRLAESPRATPGSRSGIGLNEAQAAPPPIKPGAEDSGYIFMGGDPGNPKSWKRAR